MAGEDRRGRKVLIVDSDPEFGEDLRALLDGDRVVTARTITEAGEVAVGGRFDVAVLGPSFGNEAGVRSAQAILEADSSVIVVLAANVITNRILMAALQTGLVDVIDMPVTARKIQAALARGARSERSEPVRPQGPASEAATGNRAPEGRGALSDEADPRFDALEGPVVARPEGDAFDPRFDDAVPPQPGPDTGSQAGSPVEITLQASPTLPDSPVGRDVFGEKISALLARQEEFLRVVEAERAVRVAAERSGEAAEGWTEPTGHLESEPPRHAGWAPTEGASSEVHGEPTPFDPGFHAVPPGAAAQSGGPEPAGPERAGDLDIPWPDSTPATPGWEPQLPPVPKVQTRSPEPAGPPVPPAEQPSSFWEDISPEDLAELRQVLASEPAGPSARTGSARPAEPPGPPGRATGGTNPASGGRSPTPVSGARSPQAVANSLFDTPPAPDGASPNAGTRPSDLPPMPSAPPPLPGSASRKAASQTTRRGTRTVSTEPIGERGSGRVVAVMSGKGGSGKTITAVNLATALALQLGVDRVAVLDADLQFGDIALLLQLEPERTVEDLAGRIDELTPATLKQHLLSHESGLRVLAAPVLPAGEADIPVKRVIRLAEMLTTSHDIVIVDTPPIFDDGLVDLISHSDRVLLVVDMDLPSVKNAKIALDTLRVSGFPMERIRLVVNRVDSKARLDLIELERSLGREVFATIPSDRLIPQSVNEGIPAVALANRSKVARAFRRMAEALIEDVGLARRG